MNTRGEFAYETLGGDACQKFWIQPLKEINHGMAKGSFWYFYISLHETLKETFTAMYGLLLMVFPQNTLGKTKIWNLQSQARWRSSLPLSYASLSPRPLGHEHSPQLLELSTMFATFHKHLLGTPDTNLKGLRTLNALKAFTSKLPELKNAFTKIVAILKGKFTEKKVLW